MKLNDGCVFQGSSWIESPPCKQRGGTPHEIILLTWNSEKKIKKNIHREENVIKYYHNHHHSTLRWPLIFYRTGRHHHQQAATQSTIYYLHREVAHILLEHKLKSFGLFIYLILYSYEKVSCRIGYSIINVNTNLINVSFALCNMLDYCTCSDNAIGVMWSI